MMNAEETLNQLLKQGKITQQDLESLNCSVENHSFRTLVEGLHATMCTFDHDTEDCSFYNETIMDNTWTRPDHSHWIEYATALINNYQSSPEEALDAMKSASRIADLTNNLSDVGKKILKDIIDSHQLQSVGHTLSRTPQNPPSEIE